MDKYVSANKLKAKVISGEPVLFDEPTQHEIFFLLELEQSEDVKPVVHAHWIELRANNGNVHYRCSSCGKEVSYSYAKKRWKYCIGCGAKMDEEAEE